jgi:ABC-type transport system involved in multi-copper enzyme maturation permease subunit
MRIVGFILLAALAIYALQLALVVLLLAGLIFRTKETVGLLLVFGTLGMITSYPLQFLAVAGVGIFISLYFKRKEKVALEKALDDPDQE